MLSVKRLTTATSIKSWGLSTCYRKLLLVEVPYPCENLDFEEGSKHHLVQFMDVLLYWQPFVIECQKSQLMLYTCTMMMEQHGGEIMARRNMQIAGTKI